MSLRERRIRSIRRTLRECGMSPEEIEYGIQAIKDQHAHELAQSIRDLCADEFDPGDGVCPLNALEAARFIDPEVTK